MFIKKTVSTYLPLVYSALVNMYWFSRDLGFLMIFWQTHTHFIVLKLK